MGGGNMCSQNLREGVGRKGVRAWERSCRGYSAANGEAFTHRIRVRYAECDPQGVVFNANYYAYYDLLMTEMWREASAATGNGRAGADMSVVSREPASSNRPASTTSSSWPPASRGSATPR